MASWCRTATRTRWRRIPTRRRAYGDDDAVAFFRSMAAGELPPVVKEGGEGPQHASFICGFLGCDARPFNPILWSLPRAIHLHRVTQPGDRLSHLLAYALAELRERGPGQRDVLLRLSELMFVEVVRRHLAAVRRQCGIDRLAGRAARPADLARAGAPARPTVRVRGHSMR